MANTPPENLLSANPWIRPGHPRVIAHRGQSADAPEQTMVAFRSAIALGAEMIEADVRRTRDGYLVLLHDATLDRTTSGHGPLLGLTLDEVLELDAGSWFDVRCIDQHVPTLDQLFELAIESGIALCLEAKGETLDETRVVAESVAQEIERRDRVRLDVLSSFDHLALTAAVARVPGLTVAPDRLPERGKSIAADSIRQATETNAPIIQHHHEDLTPAIVARLHEAGVAIWAWPTTTHESIVRARSMGVDGLMGDDIRAITAVLSGD